MKKLICLVLALLLTLSLAACGNGSGDNKETKPQGNVPGTTTQNKTPSTTVPTTAPVSTDKEIKVPGKEIYFGAETDWVVDEDDLVTMLYENKDSMVGICYNWVGEFDGNYEGLITSLGSTFCSEASSNCRGYIKYSAVEILTTEKTTVAGYETMKFTGKVDNDGNWDCHVYGYVYVVDGVKLLVIGIVSAPEQDAQMIADIEALTDQIAGSVRTEA